MKRARDCQLPALRRGSFGRYFDDVLIVGASANRVFSQNDLTLLIRISRFTQAAPQLFL